MAHPFVPTLLVLWALSMALRGCGVTAATLPPERHTVQPEAPVTETRPAESPAASARG